MLEGTYVAAAVVGGFPGKASEYVLSTKLQQKFKRNKRYFSNRSSLEKEQL